MSIHAIGFLLFSLLIYNMSRGCFCCSVMGLVLFSSFPHDMNYDGLLGAREGCKSYDKGTEKKEE